jgi:hypothetical protein
MQRLSPSLYIYILIYIYIYICVCSLYVCVSVHIHMVASVLTALTLGPQTVFPDIGARTGEIRFGTAIHNLNRCIHQHTYACIICIFIYRCVYIPIIYIYVYILRDIHTPQWNDAGCQVKMDSAMDIYIYIYCIRHVTCYMANHRSLH